MEAASLFGWTVSDAKLTLQRVWPSFLLRKFIETKALKEIQILPITNRQCNQKNLIDSFSYTHISKFKNPHQIPGNRKILFFLQITTA